MSFPLIIKRREGLLFVSGIVQALGDESVTISGPVYLPVTGKWMDRKMKIDHCAGFIKRMQLSKGNRVFATTTDNFEISLLEDGGETNTECYYVDAYNIRYSGSFDFEHRSSRDDELKIFVGTIDHVIACDDWAGMVISFSRKGRGENRKLYLNAELAKEAEKYQGRFVVVETLMPQRTATGEVYPVVKIYS